MRGGVSKLASNYEREMIGLARQISLMPTVNGSIFIYQNAKDVLEWHEISAKTHIKDIMTIGLLYGMSEDDFSKVKERNGFMEITKEQLREFMNN